jgi:hypothetical protein
MNPRARRLATPLAALLLLLAGVAACGTLVGNPEDDDDKNGGDAPAALATAPLRVKLTDAPVDGARSVFMTFASLELQADDGTWQDVPLVAASELDVLALQNGETTVLAEHAALPVGHYAKARLKLAAGAPPRLVDAAGASTAVAVPSVDAGVVFDLPLTVAEGAAGELTLDLDLRRSLQHDAAGQLTLTPALRGVLDAEAAAIAGEAPDDGHVVCVYARGAAKDDADDCKGALATGVVRDGRYAVGTLPHGDYELRIFSTDAAYAEVDDVHVDSGKKLDLGSKGRGGSKTRPSGGNDGNGNGGHGGNGKGDGQG